MRRAFTMVELAVVLTIISVVVPVIFLVFRAGAADFQQANATLEAADAARNLSEELRLDGRTGRLAPSGLTFEGSGVCFPVSYRLVGSTVVREAPQACGGVRALVRHVTSLERAGGLVTLRIAQLPEDLPITMMVSLGAPR